VYVKVIPLKGVTSLPHAPDDEFIFQMQGTVIQKEKIVLISAKCSNDMRIVDFAQEGKLQLSIITQQLSIKSSM